MPSSTRSLCLCIDKLRCTHNAHIICMGLSGVDYLVELWKVKEVVSWYSMVQDYMMLHAICGGLRWAQNRLNTLRQRQNGRHFPDDIFKCFFLIENVPIAIKISLKFVPKGPINYIPALVQIMAWRRPGYKPLSEPMMVCLTTHICVTRPQWVKLTEA